MDSHAILSAFMLIYSLNCAKMESIPRISDGTLDGLYNFQTRGHFLFWDDTEVYNDMVTKYNNYYTPAQIPNEEIWVDSKCNHGEFVNGFEIKDKKCCYFQGRRILEIVFKCGTVSGIPGNSLNIYNRFKIKYALRESKSFNGSDCKNGYYKSMGFDYYVTKDRPYLVDAWGLRMNCVNSGGKTTQQHLHEIKAFPEMKLTGRIVEKANVDCADGKAICGFQNKIKHNQLGTFEGLYFKVICCTV